MKKYRRYALVMLGSAISAAAGAHLWRPTIKVADRSEKVDLEKMLPARFGTWRVDERLPVILPSPDLQQRLSTVYNQTLSRTYVNGDGEHIMVSIAYGGDQSDGTRAHRPESCYPAQGFTILSNSIDTLLVSSTSKPIRVRRLLARSGARWEPITYWIVVGNEIALSGTEQKLAQLNYGVRGLIPDGVLMRISNLSRDTKRSYALHDDFVRQSFSVIVGTSYARFFGAAQGA